MAICLKIELQTKQVSPKHKYVFANGKAGRYFCPYIIQPMSTYSISGISFQRNCGAVSVGEYN